MRVCFILSSLRLSGGVKAIIQYANLLADRGHQITFVVPGNSTDAEMVSKVSDKISIVQTKRRLKTKAKPISLAALAVEMAKAVPASDVIVSTHTPTTVVGYLATKVLKKGKLAWFFMDYAEMFTGRPIEQWLLRHALIWHKLAITFSESCREELQYNSPGRVIKIKLGIDTVNIYHPVKTGDPGAVSMDSKKHLLFVGDSRPRKGLEDFLRAAESVFSAIPGIELWIVSKEELLLESRVPSKLILKPNDAELVKLYSSCDMFVSASWQEGFGLPPLEAMACGAPLVVTDSSGIREYAVDHENCLIVPRQNPEMLAGAIQTLLMNQELMDKFRKNGPLTAAKFSWTEAVEGFEKALSEVMAS